MSGTGLDYTSPWAQRLKWLYLLTVVFCLLLPVFYTIYVSFNAFGFGSPKYEFTLDYYVNLFASEIIRTTLGWTLILCVMTVVTTVPMGLLAAKFYKQTRFKVPFVVLMLMPLFIPADIMAAALLVYFKNLNALLADFGLIEESRIETTGEFQDIAALNQAIVVQITNHPKLFAFEKFEITYYGGVRCVGWDAERGDD